MRRWRTPYIRWHHDRAPDPPESISKYLADGLPKQDTETLKHVRDYVDKLVKYRRRPVNETDLPDDAEPVDEDDSKRTTLVKEGVKCGADCPCNGGRGHGPYLYRCYREDRKLTSEYVGKP